MKDRSALRSYFLTNSIPTQDNFQDFIDSGLNQVEDGIQKIQGGPVALQAQGAGEDILFFYKNLKDANPTWKINQNPADSPDPAAAKRPGFNISDASGASRLFIKNEGGNIGLGTISPAQKLHIQVNNKGLNLPLYLRNSDGTQSGGNAVGIGFLNEAAGDWPKAAIVHERTSGYGVGSLKFLVNNNATTGAPVSLDDVKLTVTANGNTGIGTTTPGFPLSFSNDIGDKIALWGQAGNSYGFGIQGSLLQIHSDIPSSDIAFGSGSSAKFAETMRIKGNGNVGIGITNPQCSLSIAGTDAAIGVDNSSTFQAKNAAGVYENFLWPRWSDNVMYLNYGKGGFNIRNNASNTAMYMLDNGNIGINTTNPVAKLHVVGAIHAGTSEIYFTDTNHGHTGYGNTAGLAAIENTSSHDALMILGRANAGNPPMRRVKLWDYLQVNGNLDVTGNVGIGTSTPRAKLDVVGFAYSGSLTYAYFNLGGTIGKGTWSNVPVSIYASNRIVAEEFEALSDSRIKTDIEMSDGAEDLRLVNKLEVANYRFKELTHYTAEKKKGFIAQQVEQIIPAAVLKHTDFIPSVNALPHTVDLTENVFTITMKDAHQLTDDDKVRLITAQGYKEVNIKVVNEHTFAVHDWKEETTDVFVYGKQVADFRSLNYDHIFCTGISAIQQLYRQMQQLKEDLAAVKERLLGALVPAM